jgi:hypothetical protein
MYRRPQIFFCPGPPKLRAGTATGGEESSPHRISATRRHSEQNSKRASTPGGK